MVVLDGCAFEAASRAVPASSISRNKKSWLKDEVFPDGLANNNLDTQMFTGKRCAYT